MVEQIAEEEQGQEVELWQVRRLREVQDLNRRQAAEECWEPGRA